MNMAFSKTSMSLRQFILIPSVSQHRWAHFFWLLVKRENVIVCQMRASCFTIRFLFRAYGWYFIFSHRTLGRSLGSGFRYRHTCEGDSSHPPSPNKHLSKTLRSARWKRSWGVSTFRLVSIWMLRVLSLWSSVPQKKLWKEIIIWQVSYQLSLLILFC